MSIVRGANILHALWPPGLSVMVLFLAACTSFSINHAEIRRNLNQGHLDLALQGLDKGHYGIRDQVLYQLDKGMLLRAVGDYRASNELFESAKLAMEPLSAISISENIFSVTVNEGTRSYVGQPYEQLLLYAYKALNYIALGDINAARVEMLQADVKMREWLSAADWEGIKASVFVRYLAGIVFELSGELDNALIAYRKAYQVLQDAGAETPEYLQRDLLRLTAHQSLTDEHKKLRSSFSVQTWPEHRAMREQAEIILIYHQGLVSMMQEKAMHIFSPELSHLIRVVAPYYPLQTPHINYAWLRVSQLEARTEMIENVDTLARENLNTRMPGITTRTLARVVAKKVAASNTSEKDSFAGLLLDIAGLVSERADTRSWSSLPASIQIARIVVPPGEYRIQTSAIRSGTMSGDYELEHTINVTASQINVISIHDIAN